MRQKSTVYSPSFHNQFEVKSDEVKREKGEKVERDLKDRRQGQSDFRIKKRVRK
ncbi:MAG: hypothetical protein UV37_C0023G0006 [Candidatus Collierbacteria bacterium GW2011_GWA1_42_60]|uniref:Uncharacterized protein n=1 Tax=Candidatus Collierbacteria bacterium GW2011_GWA2_42_17 TaxID=1618378 RepID=A0A0G0Z1E4_9BACT|nr:MAG: hypothetical protein UU94_C0018G0006 [Candidatus Collierbacteria bacterium GW2011_GWB2_42_12]KKS42595.1 MAG: hypothetical protein UV06_C0009G0010 [Candidatus Collierbacteria bacterium GW2011_GWA2_42_17]KKS61315.1 MAG: hypothetical protein UV29_C0042G0004 [Candidatus Collierbacteria bacterium GW2011_GWD2_42_50]KKS62092.1 MAG: hypothetical protein UV28_C0018G0005 [Candidatus Collierbacteria bacterium GW2011_GWE2_42_48]KKS64040.1 MAG: hypothetical protein UV32_C0027G0006 [Candidatus Collie